MFAQGRKRKIANAQNGNARMRCENDEGMVSLVSDEDWEDWPIFVGFLG